MAASDPVRRGLGGVISDSFSMYEPPPWVLPSPTASCWSRSARLPPAAVGGVSESVETAASSVGPLLEPGVDLIGGPSATSAFGSSRIAERRVEPSSADSSP